MRGIRLSRGAAGTGGGRDGEALWTCTCACDGRKCRRCPRPLAALWKHQRLPASYRSAHAIAAGLVLVIVTWSHDKPEASRKHLDLADGCIVLPELLLWWLHICIIKPFRVLVEPSFVFPSEAKTCCCFFNGLPRLLKPKSWGLLNRLPPLLLFPAEERANPRIRPPPPPPVTPDRR